VKEILSRLVVEGALSRKRKRALAVSLLCSFVVAAICGGISVRAADSQANERFRTFLFGVDYYPEQWPESYWEQDARRMEEAGVNAVRMGEFGWSVMEPAQGNYDFSLFDRAISILGHHGIKTILGTPTATPPKWLTQEYPEVLHVFPDGQKANDQTRRHYCYNSSVYRKLSREIVEAMAAHFENNPNVIGWQIDNEFNNENPECYSESCRVTFRRWLEAKYGDLDSLNTRWGTRFWSQWYRAWDQVDLPFPATSLHNPALMLDFKRFISDSVESYAGEQIAIIRKHRPNDFITTNGVFRNIDYYSFSKPLDLYAVDNYPTFSDLPQYPTGASFTLARGFNGKMMVMEELTGPAGQTYLLRTPRPGEMSLWAFQAIAHGADGVLHFRWRTARIGVEEYWSGVLDQDNIPGEKYEEFKREGEQIRAIGSEVLGSKLVSQIAVLNDFEDEWVFDYQYLSRDMNSGYAYTNLFRAASELKYNIDFVGPEGDFSKYRVIFAPRLVLIDSAMAQKIRSFVESGGVFILAAHSALKDRDNALIDQPRPAMLSELFGVQVDSTQIYSSSQRAGNSVRLAKGGAIPVEILAERLKTNGARTVGTWEQEFSRGSPAYTENTVGNGVAVYYGSLISLQAARSLLGRYAAEKRVEPLITGIPREVEVTCRTKGNTDYFFVLNHEDHEVQLSPGPGYFDLLRKKPAAPAFPLGAFQYAVLKKTRVAPSVASSRQTEGQARSHQ